MLVPKAGEDMRIIIIIIMLRKYPATRVKRQPPTSYITSKNTENICNKATVRVAHLMTICASLGNEVK